MELNIAIATNIKFYEMTLPVIINSLVENGIDKKNINVFNSGFKEYRFEIIDDIKHHFLDHNSYEYSPLIEIVEKELISDYWFLIHDTCKVGKNFKNLLYNIPNSKPEKIALKTKPAMSIGSYRYDYLISIKDKIMPLKNTDYSIESMMYWKNWGVPNEDYILWMLAPNPLIYNDNNNNSVLDYENWYGTNIQRRTEYFHSLDLYKNKSNWGQTGNNMVIDL